MYEQSELQQPAVTDVSPRFVEKPERQKQLRASHALTIFRAKMELRKQEAMRKHARVCRKADGVQLPGRKFKLTYSHIIALYNRVIYFWDGSKNIEANASQL